MKLSKTLRKFVQTAREGDTFWVEQAKLDFAIMLEKRRKSAGLTNAALAQKLGTSAAYITKLFRGDANLTIESMTKLARVTGGHLTIQILDEEPATLRWTQPLANLRLEAANHATLRTESVVSMHKYMKGNEPIAA